MLSIEGGGPTRLEDLPPMPKPALAEMRSQATSGVVVVLVLIALLAGLPHGSAAAQPPFTAFDLRSVGFALLYGESFLAIFCLCGLLWGDPGTLKRSPERCFPLPQVVLDKLRTGEPLGGLENVYEGGNVFCVRCCIWRPDGQHPSYRDQTHHCSTCNRCVVDFDHHCGVFGRCIAGKGWRGNMGYFKGILMCACAGIVTCIVTIATDTSDVYAEIGTPDAQPRGG